MDVCRDETHCSPRSLYGTRWISVEMKPTLALEYFMELERILEVLNPYWSPRIFYLTNSP
jgi:hypothetical protein